MYMWRNINIFGKIIFTLNIILGVLLFFTYLLPFIPPRFSPISFLSIFTPILLIVNVLFILLWLFMKKKNILFSAVIILVGLPFIHRFFQWRGEGQVIDNQINIMTFNVRIFNHYNWNPDKKIRENIIDFIKEKHPKIIALQEFYKKEVNSFDFYKYKRIIYKKNSDKIGQAILSDYPIISSGSLNFPETGNNGVFADIVINKDTIRLYSVHFESLHLDDDHFSDIHTKRFFSNISNRFSRQQEQVEILEENFKKCPYKKIVCGDFNNTAFSYLYQKISSNNLIDSFQEAGSGFGKTYDFKYFPFRIDYIFIDKSFQITGHKAFSDIRYSDHFPIMASFE